MELALLEWVTAQLLEPETGFLRQLWHPKKYFYIETRFLNYSPRLNVLTYQLLECLMFANLLQVSFSFCQFFTQIGIEIEGAFQIFNCQVNLAL